MLNVLITGMAGFIGFHLSKSLMNYDVRVVGVDNLNNYYDTDLKYSRLKVLGINCNENKEKVRIIKNFISLNFLIHNAELISKIKNRYRIDLGEKWDAKS